MIGEAQTLVDVPAPAGVQLRRVTSDADVRAMCAMQAAVFEDPDSDEEADALLRRLTFDDGMELWVAEIDGEIISAGRLEPVPGTELRRYLGRCNQARMARPRHLPGSDRRTGKGRPARRQDADPQRLDRILTADPRTRGPGPGINDYAVLLECTTRRLTRRSSERRDHAI